MKMHQEKLKESLRQIKIIVDAALGENPLRLETKRAGRAVHSASREGLPAHILALRDDSFFAQPKTFNEVHAKLAPNYACDVDRVKVACLRLQKRKEIAKDVQISWRKNQGCICLVILWKP
jgi:hypothetical protein